MQGIFLCTKTKPPEREPSLDVGERLDNEVNRKQKEPEYKRKGPRDGLPSLKLDAIY